jgi:long-chain acyl-CoA synthetase
VPVPVNRSQQREILEFVFSQCDSTATLVGEDVDVNTASRRVEWHRTSGSVRDIALTRVKGGDDAMILYTSGTTGRPKGVRHSHHALALNAVEMSAMLQLTDSDRVFLNIPFYYSNSISHLLMTLFNGSCLYASHGFLFGDALIEAVTRSRATGFGGVPAHYVRIADGTKGPIDTDLRFLMNSGDHLPIDVLKALLGIFPGAQIFCAYGISECAPRVCCLDPKLLKQKMGSVGRPLPATEVVVRDEEGCPVPVGELGGIYVKSGCLMKEYFRNSQATQRSIGEHGFRTGDMGYLDEDGCLFLSGRQDSVFKSGGEKVSCRLIEETLRESKYFGAAFRDVVVADAPDHFLGKVARVYYVPRGDDEDALKMLRKELKRTLPKSHIPKDYVALKAIERSPSGKIVKQRLLDSDNLRDPN